ncbi:MAG: hypothetical protein VKN13_06135 [Cyanobacteriota bacterium]|nr:hypothetical protein [Cyanobacteriota bacterium]
MDQRRCGGLVIASALALGATVTACGTQMETPQATARPGQVLVRVAQERVLLVAPFRAAVPNSLLDGVVRVEGPAGQRLVEVNAVCSMPDLPGWPDYDNLYGRTIRQVTEAKGPSGRTEWQVLFPFRGQPQVRSGSTPGPWVARLRDNLCRRGEFDDRAQRSGDTGQSAGR